MYNPERDAKYGEVESDLNTALEAVVEAHRNDPEALAMGFASIIEILGERVDGFEDAFEKIRAGEYGEEAARELDQPKRCMYGVPLDQACCPSCIGSTYNPHFTET